MEFTDLPIPEPVMAGVRACGFMHCTPIQALTLPRLLAGHDVAGQAQTGTGKTAAYLIALYARLLALPRKGSAPSGPDSPRALIIAPTRELVVQVERDARALGAHTGFAIASLYGGVDYEKQKLAMAASRIDLLIGTPGRLIDFYKQKIYTVKEVEALVIDEADRMFDMGFIADLRYLLRRLPSFEKRLSVLFSATLSYRAQELSYEYMNNPAMLAVESDVKTAAQVRQLLYHVEASDKIRLLVGILRVELAEETTAGGGRVMIFVNTKRMGEKLQAWLQHNGIHAGYLSGDVPQIKRLKVLQRFQDGELPVLIATDVAGRGLHIAGVTHVVNFDLPENAEDYVHRIGRTARAGAEGDAISLVDEEGAYNLEAVETFINMKIDVAWADDALLPKLARPPHVASSSHARPLRTEARDRGGRGQSRSRSPNRQDQPGSRSRTQSRATTPAPSSSPTESSASANTDASMPAPSPGAEAPHPVDTGKVVTPEAPPKRSRRRSRKSAASPSAGGAPTKTPTEERQDVGMTHDEGGGAVASSTEGDAVPSQQTPSPPKKRRRRTRRPGASPPSSQTGTTHQGLVDGGSQTEGVPES
ncbi:MAG: DEAD/DEAH box helicase [Magnetococcales bacterium]|nr:DEAD/DEAH box helicase [Magnetococcales bacterium]MBF0322738.1 DEAD/DEAH box helicase [Magnetococcales bacterium]